MLTHCNLITLRPDGAVSKDELLELVFDCLTKSDVQEKDKYVSNMDKYVEELFPRLTSGLNMNMMLQKIDGFEFNQERIAFHLLNIPVYHGWIVDPKDEELNAAVGTEYYETLMVNLKKFESDPADPRTIIEQSGNTTGKTDTDTHRKWKRIDDFLKENSNQLTVYGLSKLHDEIKEQELCVLYYNDHFSTLFKQSGSLYLLQNDEGYKNDANVIWEKLDDVKGGGEFVNSSFINTLIIQTHSSTISDEELARHLQEQEFVNQQQQQQQQQKNQDNTHETQNKSGRRVRGPTEADKQNSIPRRKLINIENLLRIHGGEKVGRESQAKNRHIADLREALASKNYQETAFEDWFEPHDAVEVSNRLIPRSAEGRFSAYTAAEIPSITTILINTENSSSSGSLDQRDNFPQVSDPDNYANVTKAAEKARSKSKHLEDHSTHRESPVPAEGLASDGNRVAVTGAVSKAKSSKPHHSKIQKTRPPKPRVPPKGNVTQSVGPNLSSAPEKSRSARTRYGLRPQDRITYAQNSNRTVKWRRPKTACQQNLDNASNTGVDLDEADTSSDEIGNNNLREAKTPHRRPSRGQSLKKPEEAASSRPVPKDASPGIGKSKKADVDPSSIAVDWGSNNVVDGDSREGSDGEYAGFGRHGVSVAIFTKEYLRYHLVVKWLRFSEQCCVLLDRHCFDVFDPKNPDELGTHVLEKADLSQALVNFEHRWKEHTDYVGYILYCDRYRREEPMVCC